MTFEQFRATGRDVDDVGAAINDHFAHGRGRVYVDTLFTEDTSDWDGTDNPTVRGRWYTIIGRSEFQDDDIVAIERILYDFATSEGYWIA